MANALTDLFHNENTSNGAIDPSAPLRGYVICCTSVPDEQRVSDHQEAYSPQGKSMALTDKSDETGGVCGANGSHT
jgi:hypothetical protein